MGGIARVGGKLASTDKGVAAAIAQELGNGYTIALVSFGFLANEVVTTEEAKAMRAA